MDKRQPAEYLRRVVKEKKEKLKTGEELAWGLAVELAWAVFFVVLARWLYRLGLRHYSAFGG